MSNAKIDQNDVKTKLAWNETSQAVEPVRTDAVFGYLEIFIAGSASGTYTAIPTAKIDQNDVKTLLGYNETTGLVEALRCDNNGNLLITFI